MPALFTIAACFGAALLVTLVLAAFLTPRHWWRRANVRALAVLGLGTAGIGCLLLYGAGGWPARQRAPLLAAARPAPPTAPGRQFRVYDDLNLRAASGTGAARIAVVPAGARVTATGVHDGDWWLVTASVRGQAVQGWASSLWLRRDDEAAPR